MIPNFAFTHSTTRCAATSGGIEPELEAAGEVTSRGGKYPRMTAHYESANVRGLFFAGATSHALDYRRAAGVGGLYAL